MSGNVAPPTEWKDTPISETTLTVEDNGTMMSTKLLLKTHYVYSFTAAQSLGHGRSYGLLAIRSIDSVKTIDSKRKIAFSSTPLIIGGGGGKLLEIL
ncbi:MAG TPA: hypothetical protein VLZ07_00135 [Syntrophales bacterium]|nr:hypothetical protein [Syntrophales bacterium]